VDEWQLYQTFDGDRRHHSNKPRYDTVDKPSVEDIKGQDCQ